MSESINNGDIILNGDTDNVTGDDAKTNHAHLNDDASENSVVSINVNKDLEALALENQHNDNQEASQPMVHDEEKTDEDENHGSLGLGHQIVQNEGLSINGAPDDPIIKRHSEDRPKILSNAWFEQEDEDSNHGGGLEKAPRPEEDKKQVPGVILVDKNEEAAEDQFHKQAEEDNEVSELENRPEESRQVQGGYYQSWESIVDKYAKLKEERVQLREQTSQYHKKIAELEQDKESLEAEALIDRRIIEELDTAAKVAEQKGTELKTEVDTLNAGALDSQEIIEGLQIAAQTNAQHQNKVIEDLKATHNSAIESLQNEQAKIIAEYDLAKEELGRTHTAAIQDLNSEHAIKAGEVKSRFEGSRNKAVDAIKEELNKKIQESETSIKDLQSKHVKENEELKSKALQSEEITVQEVEKEMKTKLEEKDTKIQGLAVEAVDLTSRAHELRRLNAATNEKTADLQGTIERKDTEIKAMGGRKDIADQKLRESQDEIMTLKSTIEQNSTQLNSLDEDKQKLETILAQKDAHVRTLSSEKAELERQWKYLTEAQKISEAKVADQEEELEDAGHKFQALNSQVGELEDKVDDLNKELELAEKETVDRKQTITTLNDTLDMKDSKIDILGKEIKATQITTDAEIASTRKANSELESALQKAINDVERLGSEKAGFEKEIKDLDVEIAGLRKEHGSSRAILNGKVVSLQSEKVMLESTVRDLNAQLSVAKHAHRNVEKDLDDSESKFRSLQSENEASESTVHDLNAQLSVANHNYADVKKALNESESENRSLELLRDTFSREIDRLEKGVEAREKELFNAKRSRAQASQMLNQNRNEMQELNTHKADLKKQVTNLTGKEKAMERNLAELERTDAQSRADLNKLRPEMQALTSTNNSLGKRIMDLMEKDEATTKEKEALTKCVDVLTDIKSRREKCLDGGLLLLSFALLPLGYLNPHGWIGVLLYIVGAALIRNKMR